MASGPLWGLGPLVSCGMIRSSQSGGDLVSGNGVETVRNEYSTTDQWTNDPTTGH